MNDSILRLIGISRRLSGTFCLKIRELTVERGEILAVLGPTGAGKTTLLRLLTGLESPDEGTICLNDAPLGRASPLPMLRRVAMVHQRPILLSGSVESNVGFGIRVRGGDARSKVQEALGRLDLGRLAKQSARSLSGGQAQLVALARALVLEPEVLTLDEPTANLDPASVALVEGVIAQAQLQRGATVVWATHNLFQARRVSGRVALLLGGELVEVAAKDAFFDSPGDPRTADFIEGKMVY